MPYYRTFLDELTEQYQLLERIGLRVIVTELDPYTSAHDLRADLEDRQLKVWSTEACGNPHCFFTDEQNDMLRAVHDGLGHGLSGGSFGPRGEEQAYQAHAAMFSPHALRALVTETRGQTAMFNSQRFGGVFPIQKLTLLPRRFSSR